MDEQETIAAMLAVVLAEFGDRLDEAGTARVREQLQGIVANRAALAAAAIENSDEPGAVFAANMEG